MMMREIPLHLETDETWGLEEQERERRERMEAAAVAAAADGTVKGEPSAAAGAERDVEKEAGQPREDEGQHVEEN